MNIAVASDSGYQEIESIFESRCEFGVTIKQAVKYCYYAQGFTVVCVFRFLKYSNISSFVILANFSLNLSLS